MAATREVCAPASDEEPEQADIVGTAGTAREMDGLSWESFMEGAPEGVGG